MQEIDSFKGWLSVAVGGFKSAITKFAHAHNIDFAWQTRFHDAIIKNQTSMNEIAKYIENNVSMWNRDCFNKKQHTLNSGRDGARPVSTNDICR